MAARDEYDDVKTTNTISTSPDPPHIQDPAYYFPDGNALLIVEETLFKVHTSVLGRESEVFRQLLDSTEQVDSFSASDELVRVDLLGDTAFRIPGVKAEHFRNFLFMFYGLPSNHGYRVLMSYNHDLSQDLVLKFYIYLDVAEMAMRFLAPNLQVWAHGQLRRVTKSAYEELSRHALRPDYQMRALLYSKRTRDEELATNVRNAIQLHFTWVSKNSPLKPTTLNAGLRDATRERIIQMFKHPGLQEIDSALFGFAFCSLLDLGHEVWMKNPLLSRDDRVMLLSGQVHLTPLPLSALGLEWMGTLGVHNQSGEGTPIECCLECNFFVAWEAAFGDAYRLRLCANTPPLCGISQLAILPFQRLQLAGLLYEDDPSNCQNSCRERIMDFVDKRIQDTYVRLAEFCRNVE